MKFPFLFKSSSSSSPWPWPACVNNPRTLSFRLDANTNIYKTMNSAYNLHDKNTPEDSSDAAVVRGMRSDRLFFEPGETSSILEEAKAHALIPYKDDTVNIMAMDSDDPFMDFRESMEEMVDAGHALIKDWESLEQLLTCYLKVNSKTNHGYIVGAFVDLLINLALANSDDHSSTSAGIDDHEQYCSSSSNTTTHYSFTSPLSFSSSSTHSSISPPLLQNEDQITLHRGGGCASAV